MKNLFKKVVAIVATAAMAAGLFVAAPAESVKAEDKIQVVVTKPSDWETVKIHVWNAGEDETSWPGKDAVSVDGDKYTFEVITSANGTANIIFNNGGNGLQTVDIVNVPAGSYTVDDLAIGDDGKYDSASLEAAISSGASDNSGDDASAETVYTVAGTAGLAGVEWDPAQNEMSLNDDGKYEVTFLGIPAGSYEFKVVQGKAWGTADWGQDGGNFMLEVKEAGDIKIVFDPATGAIQVVENDEVIADNGIAATDNKEETTEEPTTEKVTQPATEKETKAEAEDSEDGISPVVIVVIVVAVVAVAAGVAVVVIKKKKSSKADDNQ